MFFVSKNNLNIYIVKISDRQKNFKKKQKEFVFNLNDLFDKNRDNSGTVEHIYFVATDFVKSSYAIIVAYCEI